MSTETYIFTILFNVFFILTIISYVALLFSQTGVQEGAQKMNEEKLKPCAWCGGKAKIGSLGGDMENWAIWCSNCDIPCSEKDTKEETIEAWNQRTQPDELSHNKRMQLALDAGFMISTMYGQEEPNLMPCSDVKTIKKFYNLIAKEIGE